MSHEDKLKLSIEKDIQIVEDALQRLEPLLKEQSYMFGDYDQNRFVGVIQKVFKYFNQSNRLLLFLALENIITRKGVLRKPRQNDEDRFVRVNSLEKDLLMKHLKKVSYKYTLEEIEKILPV